MWMVKQNWGSLIRLIMWDSLRTLETTASECTEENRLLLEPKTWRAASTWWNQTGCLWTTPAAYLLTVLGAPSVKSHRTAVTDHILPVIETELFLLGQVLKTESKKMGHRQVPFLTCGTDPESSLVVTAALGHKFWERINCKNLVSLS